MFQLDKFLRVYQEVELPDHEKVIVRVLSDLEMNARGDYAVSEQVRMTQRLKNPESEEYKTKISALEEMSDEQLRDLSARSKYPEYVREASEVLYRIEFYPYPDDATDKDKVDTELRQKAHEEDVYGKRVRHITDRDKAYREKIESLSRESLLKMAQEQAAQLHILTASINAETYFTISRAFETVDRKQRWTIDQVKELPSKVIDGLIRFYKEVDSIDPWELTKSVSPGDSGGVD